MAGEWMDRTIRGPAAEYLTADEFGKLFGMSGDFIRNLVEAGTVPPPVKLGKQTYLYTWRHAVLLALRMELPQTATDLSDGVKGKPGRQTADTGV